MQKELDTLSWLITQARRCGADAADGLFIASTDISAGYRMGQPEDIERSESAAIGLRVLCGHKQAVVSTTGMHTDALRQLADQAVTMARAATDDPDSTLADASLYPDTIPDLNLEDGMVPDIAWLQEQSRIAEDAGRDIDGITNSEGAHTSHNQTILCLAAGDNDIRFAHCYRKSMFSISASLLAGTGDTMERDHAYSSARHCADLFSPQSIGIQAACRALRRLNPQKIATQAMPVVFDPRTARSLLGIFARSISGSAIARGTSFLKNKMNQPVFAPGITITDDPLIVRGLASRPFDGEGVKTQACHLVEDGMLKSWLLDVRTANKLGLITTGHAARALGSPPSPAASNLYMHNGTLSPEELIQDIKHGVYITETFGMGINTVTGDYSQGASGLAIINGEIAHPVSEITIAGNLADMFAHATPANDLEFLYAANSPTLRIDAMTIAGV
ncbi:MAG: TldD/PmbA family protein [Alphaproteobacteria bacterium]